MSIIDDARAVNRKIEEEAEKRLDRARANLSGAGLACFPTMREQCDAIADARAEVNAAEVVPIILIVSAIR